MAKEHERPYYDHHSRTHYVSVPSEALGSLPMVMLDSKLFADSVSGEEWVWIEPDDGSPALLGRVTGIAAVVTVEEEQPE